MTLWWIGNAVMFFVVLPVVIVLVNRLLIPDHPHSLRR